MLFASWNHCTLTIVYIAFYRIVCRSAWCYNIYNYTYLCSASGRCRTLFLSYFSIVSLNNVDVLQVLLLQSRALTYSVKSAWNLTQILVHFWIGFSSWKVRYGGYFQRCNLFLKFQKNLWEIFEKIVLKISFSKIR